MPPQKVPHRKVRTGCVQCKQRRIKCDEAKPACDKCTWHSLTCHYAAPACKPRTSSTDTSNPRDAPPFCFSDFALFHNWNLHTAESLASNVSLKQAMREVVPLLAIDHEFLMHALLSLSSLHLAYMRPDEAERFEVLATRHQNIALPLFRSALACVTEQNCHALYVCGHLVTKYALATPKLRLDLLFSSSIESTIDLMGLLRGSFAIHDYALEWLSNGPLGFCLEKPIEQDPDPRRNPHDSRLAHLLALLLNDTCDDTLVCCSALQILRKLFAMAATPNQTISTKTLAYSWPIQVPERFIMLVGEKKPEALVVLAHYCVMLRMIDSFWFMKGCAAGILKQCRDNLDSKWQPTIRWSMDAVGLRRDEA